jgi:DNA-binding NarL/FixJ family response regulator
MKDGQDLKLISIKLNLLIALFIKPQLKDLNNSEKISYLLRFGLPNGEIADIIGTSKGTVDVVKSRIKNRR